jgi:hypothetical protein
MTIQQRQLTSSSSILQQQQQQQPTISQHRLQYHRLRVKRQVPSNRGDTVLPQNFTSTENREPMQLQPQEQDLFNILHLLKIYLDSSLFPTPVKQAPK